MNDMHIRWQTFERDTDPMTRLSTTTAAMFCTVLSACTSQTPEAWSSKPPCPNVIPEREAVHIAAAMTHARLSQYGDSEFHSEWHDAVWSVLLTQGDGPFWLIVNLRADGRVIDCGVDVECRPDTGLDVPACSAAGTRYISKRQAIEVAANYVRRENVAPMPVRAYSATWFSAHWRIWAVPMGVAPVDSDLVVYVSYDGSEAVLGADMKMPPDGSFMTRQPGPN